MHGSRQISYTLGTGPRACGKTTLLRFIHRLANAGPVIFGDTSGIIDFHQNTETRIGLQLASYQQERMEGKILPEELVFDAVIEWINIRQSKQEVHHVLLAGSPRGEKQSKLWKDYAGKGHLRVIHIQATEEEVRRNIKTRQEKEGGREDEAERAVKNAWNEYERKVVPGVKYFNGQAIDLPRSMPMRTRLEKTIQHMAIDDRFKSRFLQRLATPTHPVSIDVDRLDGVTRH